MCTGWPASPSRRGARARGGAGPDGSPKRKFESVDKLVPARHRIRLRASTKIVLVSLNLSRPRTSD